MSHNLGGSFQSFDLHRSDIHKHTILVRKNDTITSSKTFGSVSRKILSKHYTVHAEMRRAGFSTLPYIKLPNCLPQIRHSRKANWPVSACCAARFNEDSTSASGLI